MNVSRPVVAFALLRQSSDLLRTDLLGGVAILIRPLVADLSGNLYDANVLADRMAKAYGISLPSSALEGFMPRLVTAGVLRVEELPGGLNRAVYCDHEQVATVNAHEELEFQEIIDDFLNHVKPLLSHAKRTIEEDALVSGFLTHLSTLDFSSIRALPIIAEGAERRTIQGPSAKEQKALSDQLAQGAAIDVLVASYVSTLKETNPGRLALLARVADGALGAELVLDLQAPTAVSRLANTTAIVDTPILLSYLDLSSKQDHEAAMTLIAQIVAAGAKVAAFRHSIEEAEGVLAAIQSARNVGEAYGPTIPRLSNSVYRAFFESMMRRVGSSWQQKFEIIQETATHYYKNFSAAEEEALTHEIQHSLLDRRLTRERDAKSVAETMRRLGGAHIPINQVSACKYVFVTGNRSLQAKVARFLRARSFVNADEFTPILTDRYMSGLCWLISGGKSANSPSVARLLANCAAALRLRPELAERTKRFIAGLDEEKARHFEALMTNERASQYLVEVTVGNPDVLTMLDAESVFEEMQRRAAEKVAKEKDDFYAGQLAELQARLSEEQATREGLQEQVATTSIDANAKSMQAAQLAEALSKLKAEATSQTSAIDSQTMQVSQLGEMVQRLGDAADAAKADLVRHRKKAIISAEKYADRWFLVARIAGAAALFSAAVVVGLLDRFWLPSLSVSNQRYANYAIVLVQAVLGIVGISVLADKFFTGPAHRWRTKLYRERLVELSVDAGSLDADPESTAPVTATEIDRAQGVRRPN
jgi:hypothetical protein